MAVCQNICLNFGSCLYSLNPIDEIVNDILAMLSNSTHQMVTQSKSTTFHQAEH